MTKDQDSKICLTIHCRHRLRVSVGEVLQVYRTPDDDFPVAPAGLQKAPGETVVVVVAVAVGVGVVGVTDLVGLGVGEGVRDTVGVAAAVGVALAISNFKFVT